MLKTQWNNCTDLGRFKLNYCEDIETNPNAFEGCESKV